jgi:hypothetical protein
MGNSLAKILSQLKLPLLKRINLRGFKIENKSFWRLLSAFRYLMDIYFENIAIDHLKIIDVGEAFNGSKFQQLRFSRDLSSEICELFRDMDDVESFIKILGLQESIRSNLKLLEISRSNLEPGRIRMILKKFNLEEVKLDI